MLSENLNIIIVGHNEEENLPKLFESLKNFGDKINVFYCDQESTDNSIEIAKKYGAHVDKHPKYGICESSRIRAVKEHIKGNERILFMDADEEVTEGLAVEIKNMINKEEYEICIIPVNVYFMNMKSQNLPQPRLFKKNSVELHDVAHHRYTIKSEKKYIFKNKLINIDLKNRGCEISNYLEKLNRYTNNEVAKIESISGLKLFFGMFIKPIIRFFGFGIWRGYFFKGRAGWILAYYNSAYEFFKWAKVYEKLYLK